MKIHAWLVILGLGQFAPGCWADRPLYFANTPDASPPNGAAGTGAAGTGAAGYAGTGAAGTGPIGGSDGFAGSPGCDAVPVLRKYLCTLQGSCHDPDVAAAAARFSLGELNQIGVDWKAKLVGVYPKGGGAIPSMCFPSQVPYLIPGSSPPQGLLIDKLFATNPPCGESMPVLTGPVSATDRDCILRWANELTTRP